MNAQIAYILQYTKYFSQHDVICQVRKGTMKFKSWEQMEQCKYPPILPKFSNGSLVVKLLKRSTYITEPSVPWDYQGKFENKINFLFSVKELLYHQRIWHMVVGNCFQKSASEHFKVLKKKCSCFPIVLRMIKYIGAY